ncbi:hypothetical protein KKA14_01750, partial [bacterium]|nr:hypothetical protein [bacterium]
MLEKLQEAIDFAITNGFLKYNSQFQLIHAPFCLTPYEVSRKTLNQISELTPVFNELMLKVGQNTEFLVDQLGRAAQTDEFIRKMLKLASESPQVQPSQLMISRNDFFLTGDGTSLSGLRPKQVEF